MKKPGEAVSQTDKLREALEDVRQWIIDSDEIDPLDAMDRVKLIDAALAEPREDVVSVPREPTEAMVRAGVISTDGPAVYKVMTGDGLRTLEAGMAAAYRAMIAAALGAEGREHGK